jgi:hypothetical protein
LAPASPAEWLDFLERRLHDRWNQWSIYDNYYEGDHRFSAWLRSVQRAFSGTIVGHILNGLSDNYMPLVVDAPGERLRVQGFRFGDSEDADDDAWAIWQANGLDAQSNMVHTEAIKLGEAYWMVTPTPEGQPPLITAEHPSQVIVQCHPANRRVRLAALKKWRDGDDDYANVYLPGGVWKYRAKRQRVEITDLQVDQKRTEWEPIARLPNPLKEVPIVPMPNNPSMLRGGRSDLSFGAVSLQDQITKTIADLMIGAEYHGLPQRVMLGVEPPRDPETGKVIADAEMQKARMWYFNGDNVKAHEFSAADLKGLRDTADGFIGDLAAQTRIPIYYFRPQAISNISAEALIGLDAGLVSKTKDKETPFGEGHEEAMRLAFKAQSPDDPRAQATAAETIWANTESRSQAQVTDAVSKEVAMGLPFEAALEKLGYSPQAVDRILAMREAEALTAEAFGPASLPTSQSQTVATPGQMPSGQGV